MEPEQDADGDGEVKREVGDTEQVDQAREGVSRVLYALPDEEAHRPLELVVPQGLAASSGRLDRAFSGDGKVLTNFGSSEDWSNDVVVLGNGKTVAVGIATPGGEIYDGTGDAVFAIARYTGGGRLDPTIGRDGRVNVNFHPDPRGQIFDYEEAAVAVQPDGKLIVVGHASRATEESAPRVAVVRLTARGRFDTSFGGDGKIITRVVCGAESCAHARPDDVVVQPDGRILVGGCTVCSGWEERFLLLRYRPGGRLDPAFGNGGSVVTDVTEERDTAVDLALRRDGKIVALSASFDVVRYEANGRLDRSFGRQGVVARDLGYSASAALALQRDNKMVLAGQVYDPDGVSTFRGSSDFALVRLMPGGRLDTTFSRDGRVVTDLAGSVFCEEDRATDVEIQSDGRILAAGRACAPGIDFAVLRYRGNGSLDPTFSKDGKKTDRRGTRRGRARAEWIASSDVPRAPGARRRAPRSLGGHDEEARRGGRRCSDRRSCPYARQPRARERGFLAGLGSRQRRASRRPLSVSGGV